MPRKQASRNEPCCLRGRWYRVGLLLTRQGLDLAGLDFQVLTPKIYFSNTSGGGIVSDVAPAGGCTATTFCPLVGSSSSFSSSTTRTTRRRTLTLSNFCNSGLSI